MIGARHRFSLVEYGRPVDLSKQIATSINIDRSRANQLLIDAGNRAAAALGLSYNPISIDARGARAIDFAGLIRLAPSLELEVAPKFLGLDESDDSWREDFFFLSTLSRYGRLLARERLAASGGAPRDLSTLVARALTGMYETHKRRPLRSYRRTVEASFSLEGDADPVDLKSPGPEGFEQEVVRFDRRNEWNAALRGAARELLPEVRDPFAANSLVRLIEDLSPQSIPRNRRKPIPARHRVWRPLYELSLDVLDGLGLSFVQGDARAPGYLMETWRVWEDLLTIGARLGFGNSLVVPQKGFALGTRLKPVTGGSPTTLSVFPDCVIEPNGTRPRLILDAKYKSRAERGLQRLAEADVYEALAFCKATGCNRVVLAYPALPSAAKVAVGTCATFERVEVDGIRISGVEIETRKISKTGALRQFASGLAAHLLTTVD